MKTFGRTDSGLIVPMETPPPPPEHPVRAVIRKSLQELGERLRSFEQTTHGHFACDGISSVATDLTRAYDNPTAYTISNLEQSIERLLNPR